MILLAQMMLRLMQNDLDYAISNNTNLKGQIESCYEISNRYWEALKLKLIDFNFLSKEEEIYFFKNIKPRFTSEIEYFKLIYHFEVLNPPLGIFDKFMNLEKKRLDRFINQNAEFYLYYKSNCTEQDEIYFLRINNKSLDKSMLRPYDNEVQARTSHDHLVATIMALEKYDVYLMDREACM